MLSKSSTTGRSSSACTSTRSKTSRSICFFSSSESALTVLRASSRCFCLMKKNSRAPHGHPFRISCAPSPYSVLQRTHWCGISAPPPRASARLIRRKLDAVGVLPDGLHHTRRADDRDPLAVAQQHAREPVLQPPHATQVSELRINH